MKDSYLKITDVARETGLTEQEARKMAEKYNDLLPSHSLGRVRLYETRAVKVTQKIKDLSSQGLSDAEIRETLGRGGKKSGHKTTVQKSRSVGSIRKERSGSSPELNAAQNAEKKPPIPPVRKVRPEGKRTGPEETLALQEQQIKRLIGRLEKQERALAVLRDERDSALALIEEQRAGLQKQIDVTGEWVEYFDARFEESVEEQKKQNAAFGEWNEYFDREIARMKLSLWDRLREKYR